MYQLIIPLVNCIRIQHGERSYRNPTFDGPGRGEARTKNSLPRGTRGQNNLSAAAEESSRIRVRQVRLTERWSVRQRWKKRRSCSHLLMLKSAQAHARNHFINFFPLFAYIVYRLNQDLLIIFNNDISRRKKINHSMKRKDRR